MESSATWSVRRVAVPEPAPRRRRRHAACSRTAAAALLLVCALPLLRCCEAAIRPHGAVSSYSTETLLVPVTSQQSLPLAVGSALEATRAKDDYDYDDDGDDYGDDYDYNYGTKKKKKKKPAAGAQAAAVSPTETNLFNFVRIMVLRLVWGFASWMGFDEPLSEAFGGAFVPPGVDPDGDDDLGFDY